MLSNYVRVVRNPLYFPVWLGQLISNLGDTINYVALVVSVYKITGSGLALSTLVLFQVVPAILAAPLAGVVIDRFPRKRVLIAADLVRAALVAGLVIANAVWQVYILAFCLALAGTFFTPALSASIPALVQGEDLLAANSVAWSTAQLVQIIGSAVAGGLIAFFGTQWAFGFNAISFLISAGTIALVTFPAAARAVGSDTGSYIQSLREGMAYARADAFVSRMFAVQVLASLGVGGTSALLVVLAERRYHLPGAGFATFLFAIGLGALLGPVILGTLTRGYRDRRLLFLPYILRGAGDVLLGLLTVPLLGQMVLFVYGLNTSSGMVTYQSVMQVEIPDAMRGRVFTLMDVGWNSSRLVSIALGGLLADRFGVAVVYYLGGTFLACAGVVGLVTVPLDTQRSRGTMRA
ncbi:MAG: MFS transporter [Chloroflexota bacterium]|nr:MAG: MFS transporter [Chloroflexota bacterium]